MSVYQYIAKDASGAQTRGQVEAADRASAIASVRAQGLFPLALGEVKVLLLESFSEWKTLRR